MRGFEFDQASKVMHRKMTLLYLVRQCQINQGKTSLAVESGEGVKNADNFGDFIGSNVFWDDDNGTAARAQRNFLTTLSWLLILGEARLFEMNVVRFYGFNRGSRERE